MIYLYLISRLKSEMMQPIDVKDIAVKMIQCSLSFCMSDDILCVVITTDIWNGVELP